MGALSIGERGVSGYNTESLTVDDILESAMLLTLYRSLLLISTMSRHIAATTKHKIFHPYPTVHTFHVVVKSR